MARHPSEPLGPVVLEGRHVRLEPLGAHHPDRLTEAADHPAIWLWMAESLFGVRDLDPWYQALSRRSHTGSEYAFAVIDRRHDRIVGSTRYVDVRAGDPGAEIGGTWYTPDTWGTAINPEAKYLLRHAFDTWGAMRMQFKTDHMNLHSQRAIRKLGARYEGTLMNHRCRPDGTIRHSVLFAITNQEWPLVRTGLESRLRSYETGEPGGG